MRLGKLDLLGMLELELRWRNSLEVFERILVFVWAFLLELGHEHQQMTTKA